MALESQFLKQKATEQSLAVVLEEGESILECMKKAALEHNLEEFRVAEVNGYWKDGFMSFFLKNNFKSRRTLDIERISAGSGKFVRTGEDYTGDLHVVTNIGNNKINGTVLEGKAAKELTLKIKFVKFLENV